MKIITLACLLLFSPISVSFAADPFKAHAAGFGPEILNMRLGKSMTWIGMIDAEKKIHATRSTTKPPKMVTLPNGKRISLEIPLDTLVFAMTIGDSYKVLGRDGRNSRTGKWLILNLIGESILVLDGDRGTLSKTPKTGDLGELFTMLKKRGLNYAATPHIVVRDERIFEYSLDKTDFPTKAATAEEFMQWLSAQYDLGALERRGRNHEYRNLSEGWRVLVTEKKVQIFSTPILDSPKK